MKRRVPPEVAAQVERLFRDEAMVVFRSALSAARGDRHAAEDAVQAAFRLAALRWDMMAGCPPETRRGLLCTVAIRRAIDEHRRRKREQPAGYPEDAAAQSPGGGAAALTRVQAERCLTMIGEMPEMRRRVAYLRFHEGWTNRMIAEHLGTRPGTVAKHVFDARADLKKALPELAIADSPDGEAADGKEAP